jgi:putative toxin-antitoxin system antitoxin component (TIGR02293 family)
MGKSGSVRASVGGQSKPSPSKGRLKPVTAASAKKEAPLLSLEGGKKGAKGSNLKLTYNATDDKDLLAIIELVRDGISITDFNAIAGITPFSLAEWAAFLQLSERTIQRNQKEQKAFQSIHSQKIVELAMLYQYGVEVFGDQENFNTWLGYKSVALGGRSPKELLDTQFGVGMVKDALGRIEHGVLA